MGTAAVACSACGNRSAAATSSTPQKATWCARCVPTWRACAATSSAAGNIQKAAWSCVTLSLLGWFFDPFFCVDVLSILGGLFALRSIRSGNERFTRYLSAGAQTQVWVCTVLGLVITGVHLVIVLLAFGAVATSFHRDH
jgi:hypothetical protein